MKIRVASKSFGAKPVLGRINLDLDTGATVALLGPSGIGKTTLLRIVAGLDSDFEGTVTGSERIGIVFQEPRLLPWHTALRNVELAADIAAERATSFLEQVGMREAASLYPRQLSLGMARRVSLARALSVEPQLLILDEPFASLDETSAAAMRTLVGAATDRANIAVLLVSHDPDEVVAIADRVLILDGRPASIVADLPINVPRRERKPNCLKTKSAEIRSKLGTKPWTTQSSETPA